MYRYNKYSESENTLKLKRRKKDDFVSEDY